MRNTSFFILLIFLLFSFATKAQKDISVDIKNIRNDKGHCVVCLFNSEKSMEMKGDDPVCKTTIIKNRLSRAVFSKILQGKYAILVIHDENDNQKLDRNFLGIPREGYGASKNKLPFAGSPAFEPNSFYVDSTSDLSLNIILRYL